MAMTKKEQQMLDDLRKACDYARALRWPEYELPKPMPPDEVRAKMVTPCMRYGKESLCTKGWSYNEYSRLVMPIWSDGVYHTTSDPTNGGQWSHNAGTLYRTKADALRALRLALTISYSQELDRVDKLLADAGHP